MTVTGGASGWGNGHTSGEGCWAGPFRGTLQSQREQVPPRALGEPWLQPLWLHRTGPPDPTPRAPELRAGGAGSAALVCQAAGGRVLSGSRRGSSLWRSAVSLAAGASPFPAHTRVTGTPPHPHPGVSLCPEYRTPSPPPAPRSLPPRGPRSSCQEQPFLSYSVSFRLSTYARMGETP